LDTLLWMQSLHQSSKQTYEVENMRVGDRTDYNRLRMMIDSDGSQSPSEILSESIRIMLEQFKAMLDLKEFVIQYSCVQKISIANQSMNSR
jgi:DNA-directed RNA polymerase alpha subunit